MSYGTDTMTYTTPELLRTLAAVDVDATATMAETTAMETGMPTEAGEPTPVPTAGGSKVMAGGMMVVAMVASALML